MSNWTIERYNITEKDRYSPEFRAMHISVDSPYIIRKYGKIKSDYCCCKLCIFSIGATGNGSPDPAHKAFLMLLYKYKERFHNLPTFELVESLFDDCFKDTTTCSERTV